VRAGFDLRRSKQALGEFGNVSSRETRHDEFRGDGDGIGNLEGLNAAVVERVVAVAAFAADDRMSGEGHSRRAIAAESGRKSDRPGVEATRQGRHGRDQFGRVDRFGEVNLEAGTQGLDAILGPRVRGQRDGGGPAAILG